MAAAGERLSSVEARIDNLEERVSKVEQEHKDIREMLNVVENNSLVTKEIVTSIKETNEKMLTMLQAHDEHLNQWIGRRDLVKMIFAAIGAMGATVGVLVALGMI